MIMVDVKEKKIVKKDDIEENYKQTQPNLFGFRGYSADIISTLKNSGIEVSTPEIWDTNLSRLGQDNNSSIMRHIGSTLDRMEDNQKTSDYELQNQMKHPFLRNPFLYVFIGYAIYFTISMILILL